MSLNYCLQSNPEFIVVNLNFSSVTSPSLIMKTFEQHCEYVKGRQGLILRPTILGKRLVIFCDEINLPENDKYGTQRVLTFLRQIVEQNGFWQPRTHLWVEIQRIQF